MKNRENKDEENAKLLGDAQKDMVGMKYFDFDVEKGKLKEELQILDKYQDRKGSFSNASSEVGFGMDAKGTNKGFNFILIEKNQQLTAEEI